MRKTFGLLAAIATLAATPALAEGSLHGFGDISVKNDYITPRGLRVTSDGATVQLLNGLVWVMPQEPGSTVSEVSLVAGTWMDFNPGYEKSLNSKMFNEFDWFVGANAKVGRANLGVQYVEFISPQHAFKVEQNVEFSVAIDDTGWAPIKLNPYAKLFWAMNGDSTVVLGKRGNTYDVELGASPTFDLSSSGAPLTLSMPTWVTVGPKSYWGGDESNFGVFSTGLKLSYALPTPKDYPARWSAYVGYQYYHLINDNLVAAQALINGGKDSRNLHLVQTGISYGF